ncbi:DUF2442 domain-containing protein [Candidatus Scalindua japonica]|uniref:DUF2442 domain-containing protein n=1 Tax=Candidatus Scalindua japonica TaxID=1284222 RepID=UPI003B969B55
MDSSGQERRLSSFCKYPWFIDAKISTLINVTLLHGRHLHWSDLDVDLSLEIVENLERYPLDYTQTTIVWKILREVNLQSH